MNRDEAAPVRREARAELRSVIGFAVLLLAALTLAGGAVGSYNRGLKHSSKNTDPARPEATFGE